MHRATYEELIRGPVGRYVVGNGFLYYCAEPTLYGWIVWGRPGEDAARELVACGQAEVLPGTVPHESLLDFRALESIDPAAFRVLAETYAPLLPLLGPVVTRQAIVMPTGLVGTVVAGFYDVFPPRYPWRLFNDSAEAAAWLGHAHAAGMVAELVRNAMGESRPTRAALALLLPSAPRTTLAAAARSLGMSTRTLQRRLRDEETSFQAELSAARAKAAKALLAGTDAKLSAIALEVGCASLQHFSSLFRRLVGESPSAWRQRHHRRST